jgi:hypothetical protein
MPGRQTASCLAGQSVGRSVRDPWQGVVCLQPFADRMVVRYSGMLRGSFGGFADPEKQRLFKRRLDEWVIVWCCMDYEPFHIFYDFFWDEVPHVDRHGRNFTGPWLPTVGP